MHGLVNRSIQCFICDTYGADLWRQVAEAANLGFLGFELMLTYDDGLSIAVLDAAASILGKSRPDLKEDIGTYLVSHENRPALRRLLRFGGETFIEFLHSLDDLHDRARLAVPDLDIPHLELRDHTPVSFSLSCRWHHPGFGHVVVGMLRGMADDYGTLVLLEHQGAQNGVEMISIQVVEASFAEGRTFLLAERGQKS